METCFNPFWKQVSIYNLFHRYGRRKIGRRYRAKVINALGTLLSIPLATAPPRAWRSGAAASDAIDVLGPRLAVLAGQKLKESHVFVRLYTRPDLQLCYQFLQRFGRSTGYRAAFAALDYGVTNGERNSAEHSVQIRDRGSRRVSDDLHSAKEAASRSEATS